MNMMGLMGLAQNLPGPGVLESASIFLRDCAEKEPERFGLSPEASKGLVEVAGFMSMFAQVLRQQGVSDQAEEPTEALKLHCSTCGKEFAVSSPEGYYSRVQAGFLYACADGHDTTVLGSGRLGELVEVEKATQEQDHQVVTIAGSHAENSDS